MLLRREEKAAVQAAVQKGMRKVEATLKTKMMALEKQALLLAVACVTLVAAEPLVERLVDRRDKVLRGRAAQ